MKLRGKPCWSLMAFSPPCFFSSLNTVPNDLESVTTFCFAAFYLMSFSSRESRPRATSPYRELTKDEAEETPQSLLHYPSTRPELFNLDLCESPGTSQLNSQNRSTLSRKLSTSSKSQYEVALEQAREDSLIDVDDLETQLLPPPSQTNIVVASDRGRSLHPTDAHRRSISIQRGLNGHIQGRPKSPVSAGRNSRGSATDRSKRVCRGCKKPGKDCSFCNVCAVSLCKECWDLQIAHSEDTRAADNVPHEKTDLDIAEKVKACLEPLMTDEQQMSLHRSDENTTWFGVGKNEMEELIFEDCGRYARIMADCPSGRRSSQYPALVSFVGQTGAGKSTLIKMLIELTSNTRQGPVPVVGSVNHSVPTSGDVHLYSDPSTYNSDYPILYADCEGLEGGENEPMAVQARRGDNVAFTLGQGRRTGSFQKRLRKKHHSSQREITWATTPERRSRQYSVTNLYPRLLYTFSDAVVFVLKNARTIENVVEQLIVWASAALEKSTNQPVLPHVIIVLNATENAIDPEQWDIKFATEALMRTVTDAISTNPSFKKYVHFWKDRKKDIHDAHDLLCSYYSSVRVVRIPTKGRPQLISNQLQKLYCQIQDDCMKSREGRRRMRMLLEADELQPYLQYAFDHFSSDLDMPFDFVKASMLNNPIPRDFGGNILKLAINIMDIWHTQLNGIGIFEELSLMVASCIMLDAARHKTKGTAESIFREHYMVHCDDAIEDFCDRHWPCEMICSGGRCNNVKSGHSSKGHQLQNGKAFGSGPYYSKFSAESYGNKWKSKIHHNLQLLLSRLREANDGSESEEVVASRIHQQYVLTPFFKHVKSSENYVSHSTCFCCLIAPPEHPLPCSHVICTPCLQAFGTRKGKFVIELRTCPLWHEQPRIWNKPWQIVSKPPSAGIRILTLDGGGIRGIVELEILRLIQMHLGQTPLQEFFDLIVGTSTGGIIALGIGVEGWSIDRCIEEFSSLCDQAFTPRKGHGIWGLAHMIQGHHGSIYRTQPLQEALRQVFTENSLFGGPRFEANQTSKVAVVTTSAAGLQPIVLSNYNRICGHEEKRSYLFQRPEKPEPELRVWEAARATSAAPTYYKPFPHEPSKQVYIDGGLWHNNPVVIADLERKLIWPDEAHLPPDILLSIGSGCCQNLATPKRSPKTSRKLGIGSNVKALFRIAVDHIESSLDSEKAWRDFAERLPFSRPRSVIVTVASTSSLMKRHQS